MCAAQGLNFLLPLRGGKGADLAYQKIRHLITFAKEDRPLAGDMAKVAAALAAGAFDFAS